MLKLLFQKCFLFIPAVFLMSQYLSAAAIQANGSYQWLSSQKPIKQFISSNLFKPTGSVSFPDVALAAKLSGTIKISSLKGSEKIKIYKDSYQAAANKKLQISQLPEIEFEWVALQSDAIPKNTSVQRSSHPNWEWQVSPGKIWQQANDHGFWRIAFPFSLQEKNANCTHNGLLLLLINTKGENKNGVFQIASETCSYLQFDLAGRIKLNFVNRKISQQVSVIEQFKRQLKYKPKVYSLQDLALDYPTLNIKRLMPLSIKQSTTSGVVIKGKHYRLNCQTRYGAYPYCDYLALPSYSTAKSIFAGIGLMRLQAMVPNIDKILVSKIIPECDISTWNKVTLGDLINMRSGHYVSKSPHKDEASNAMLKFFLATSNQQKLKLACEQFPKKSRPGKRFIYHTSDTYLAGVMLNRLYQKMTGEEDFYQGILANELWNELKLSPLMQQSKRTYDKTQQAFTGWGLTYYVDDVIKLVNFLQDKTINSQWLDQTLLSSAMQRGKKRFNRGGGKANMAYNYGFWGLQVANTLACKKDKWIPFMSGFGGITVAMPSKEVLYYNYADNQRYLWLDKVAELNRHFSFCEDQ